MVCYVHLIEVRKLYLRLFLLDFQFHLSKAASLSQFLNYFFPPLKVKLCKFSPSLKVWLLALLKAGEEQTVSLDVGSMKQQLICKCFLELQLKAQTYLKIKPLCSLGVCTHQWIHSKTKSTFLIKTLSFGKN